MTRVLSGIQPTGEIHLGNYLGALRNWVAGQHTYDAFHGIVDLHALTIPQEPGVVGQQTLELAAMLLARRPRPRRRARCSCRATCPSTPSSAG